MLACTWHFSWVHLFICLFLLPPVDLFVVTVFSYILGSEDTVVWAALFLWAPLSCIAFTGTLVHIVVPQYQCVRDTIRHLFTRLVGSCIMSLNPFEVLLIPLQWMLDISLCNSLRNSGNHFCIHPGRLELDLLNKWLIHPVYSEHTEYQFQKPSTQGTGLSCIVFHASSREESRKICLATKLSVCLWLLKAWLGGPIATSKQECTQYLRTVPGMQPAGFAKDRWHCLRYGWVGASHTLATFLLCTYLVKSLPETARLNTFYPKGHTNKLRRPNSHLKNKIKPESCAQFSGETMGPGDVHHTLTYTVRIFAPTYGSHGLL